MQDSKPSKKRKPWLQKAVEMATLWKTVFKSPLPPTTNGATAAPTTWKTISSSDHIHTTTTTSNSGQLYSTSTGSAAAARQRLRRSTSLKVATSFTRVCLCAPISSYTEVFSTEMVPPRRSYSYPRSMSKSSSTSSTKTTATAFPGGGTVVHPHPSGLIPAADHQRPAATISSGRLSCGGESGSGSGRRVFRGKSVTDDVLMRRFVIEEEAMMQVRRRNEMDVIRRRAASRRKAKLGPSRLKRMVSARDDDVDVDVAVSVDDVVGVSSVDPEQIS